jgi:hypothetical protein
MRMTKMTNRIKELVTKIILISALSAIGCSFAFAQCSTITSSRPRIYLPNTAYGSYPTIKDRLNAARVGNTAEWQNMFSQATTYLTKEPSPTYFDSVGFEMAMMYAIDPADYSAYGVRSLHFLSEALQSIAPTVDITGATNASPTVFTTAAAHGLTTGTKVAAIWGGTGNWAAFNRTTSYVLTVVDSTHFSIAIDSTGFGALTGNMTVSNNGFAGLNQGRWDTPQIAAIWDWAHPLLAGNLTASQLNQIENTMVAAISYVTANPAGSSGAVLNPLNGIKNLTVGPMSGALQMAVALSGDVAGMSTICDTLRSTFLTMAPIYTTGATGTGYKIFPLAHGGAYVEGTEYGPESSFYLLCYLQVMLGATGENLYSNVGTYPADAVQYLFHDVSPTNTSSGGNWGELFPEGDILFGNQHVKTLNSITRQVMEQLAFYLCSSGDTKNCAYAEWWLKNVFTEAMGAVQGNISVSPSLVAPNEFLFYDPLLTATNPRVAYGTDYLADGYSLMLSRSAWTTSATWVGFKGGALRAKDEDHFHPNILTFGIYRNGDWLTTDLANWGGAALTRFSNSPLPETNQFGLPSEGSNPPSAPNNGVFDWGLPGMTTAGSITQHEFNTSLNYAYAEANANTVYRGLNNAFTSPAYTTTVNTVIRDFLYLKPDTYIVEDRLAYDTPLQAEWNIQSLADPGSPSGNSFTLGSLMGKNALNVAVVSPASPSYSVVSPAIQATELTSSGCGGGPGVGCPSQWRVQITSGNAVSSEQYFMVMQSGATGFTPLAVTRLTATNAVAAQFGGYVVMGLSDTSQTGASRTYTYAPNATIQHIGMGFKPSTAYSVDRSNAGLVKIGDGTGGANDITTTSGGILLFTTGSSALAPQGPTTIRVINSQ